jgi:hypothetical protein
MQRDNPEREYLMIKKTLAPCLTMAAFVAALVFPVVASASPALTFPTGTRLAAGNLMKTTNVGEVQLGTLFCTSASMTGSLVKNTGTELEVNITSFALSGTGTNGECTSSFGGATVTTSIENGLPYCLRLTSSMTSDETQMRGGSCSEFSRRIWFRVDSTTAGECTYDRINNLVGTVKTDPEDAVFTFSAMPFTKQAGGFLCPNSMGMNMSFTLERDWASAEPVYIS